MRSDLETFSLKQRVFLVKNYYQYTGDYLCVKTKYEDNYKDSNEFPPFSYDILIEIINLFERTGSVLKATEGASGGTGQIIEQIYVRDFVKEEDPMALSRGVPIPSTSSAQSTKGDHLDDQEDSMMWDQSGFASDDDDSDNTPLARKHACDQCGVSFSSLEEWNGHQMKKHNIIPDISQSSKSASHKRSRSSGNSDPLNTGLGKLSINSGLNSKNLGKETSIIDLDVQQTQKAFSDRVKLDLSYDKTLKEITKKLDRLLRIQKINFQKDITNPINGPVDEDEPDEIDQKFPISTRDELAKFNAKLKDDDYKLKAKKYLSQFNGSHGPCKSNKRNRCAYILVDYLLTRELLLLYSWTGKSRCGTKDAFSNYTHFINMFHEVIRMVDPKYSKADTYTFFKHKVLKYSAERVQMKSNRTLEENNEESS